MTTDRRTGQAMPCPATSPATRSPALEVSRHAREDLHIVPYVPEREVAAIAKHAPIASCPVTVIDNQTLGAIVSTAKVAARGRHSLLSLLSREAVSSHDRGDVLGSGLLTISATVGSSSSLTVLCAIFPNSPVFTAPASGLPDPAGDIVEAEIANRKVLSALATAFAFHSSTVADENRKGIL